MVNFLDNVTPARVLAVFEINNNSAASYTNQGTSMYKCQFYNSAKKSDLSHKGYSVKDTDESDKFYSINHRKHK